MRLLVPFTLLIAGLACKAPIDFNIAPQVSFANLGEDPSFALGDVIDVEVRVSDENGDSPITVTLTSSIDQQLGSVSVATDELARFSGLTLSGGTHTLTATADDGRDDGIGSISVELVINAPPSLPGIEVSPLNPTPADDLIGTLVTPSIDPEGSEVAYSWDWMKDGLAFKSGTTFPALLEASQTAVGDLWTLQVEAFEAAGGVRIDGGQSSISTVQVTINNNPPGAPGTVEVLPSQPHALQDLRCEADGATDPDGDPITYTYTWEVDDGGGFTAVPGQIANILPASETQAGQTWKCVAAANDGAQNGPTGDANAEVRANFQPLGEADNTITGASIEFGHQAAMLDDDANGTADSLIASDPSSSSGDGAAYLFSATTLSTTPGVDPSDAFATLTGGTGDRFGEQLRLSGDVTGDTVHDVLISAQGTTTPYVSIVDITRVNAGTGTTSAAAFAAQVQAVEAGSFSGMAAGDFDDDGRADLAANFVPDVGNTRIIVMPDAALTIGVTVQSDQGGATVLSQTLDDATIGAQLRANADITGDGIVDLFMSGLRDQNNNDQTAALVFEASRALSGGTDADALIAIDHNIGPSGTPTDAGSAIAYIPDMSGDGVAEMSIGAPGTFTNRGRIGIFAGNISSPSVLAFADNEQAVAIEGEAEGDRFGSEIVVLGDLGSDGIPEIAITAPGANSGAGKVYLFDGAVVQAAVDAGVTAGSPQTLTGADAAWVLNGASASAPASVPTAAGDLDGDGYADLVVWAPDTSTGNGRLHVYLSNR